MDGFEDIKEQFIADELASNGKEMNEGWSQGLKEEYYDLDSKDILGMAIVDSFVGSGYALDKHGFRDMAYNYMVKEDTEILSCAKDYMGRYGEENLRNALESWKNLFNEISEDCDVKMCSGEILKEFQLKALNKAFLLKDADRLPRMGPWLFCFPFKIISLYRDDLWSHPLLNDIIMPLGMEVVRGVRKLIKRKSKFTDKVDTNILREEEGGLKEGMATTFIIQGVKKKIAESSKSNVLHINSGLYLYGQES